jgi:cytochrome c556
MQSMKSTRSRRLVSSLVAGIVAIGIGAAVTVQAQQPNRAVAQQIKYRQALFTVMSRDFGWFNAVNRGQAPFDAAEAAKRAKRMDVMIGILPEAFPADSLGENSKAKPEIWTDKTEFDRLMQEFITRSAKLAQTAAGGQEADIKAAAKAVGEACGQCHDKFKSK